MELKLNQSWQAHISDEFKKPYFKQLMQFIERERQAHPTAIFPLENQVFRAFDACSFDEVKVVILGQDPYPTRGHAHGLSFSVEPDVRPLPKSLINIFKELQSDVGIAPPENGNLIHWANQGVLLLNSVLTVRKGEANSHAKQGWETFTDEVIDQLASKKSGIVYILWGAKALEKAKSVDPTKNLILSSPHPSPLSSYRGFFGSKPFSSANSYLAEQGSEGIRW